MCDTILICLFDSNAVDNILHMPNGLLSGSLEGKTIIDFTTHHYEEVLNFHKLVNQKGGKYLEAPVFGSVVPALNGLVTVVASGEKEVFELAKPLLKKNLPKRYFIYHSLQVLLK